MFKPQTANTPEEYFDQIDEPRRSEILKLHKFILEIVPDLETKIYHNIIGYGTYHYKSKSGREGDWFVIGLASQKNYISVYVCADEDGEYVAEKYKDLLPKTSIGKSCIRFKKLDDVDLENLKKVITKGAEIMKKRNYDITY